MLASNYWVQDVTDGALGAALLTPAFVAPGAALAWALDVRGFRGRSAAARAAIAVVLSVAVVPAVTYLLARATSLAVPVALYVALSLALAAAALRALRARRAPAPAGAGRVAAGGRPRLTADPMVRVGAAAVVAWAALALATTSDLHLGGRLYGSPLYFDYAKHVSVTDAIARTGVPPANPSFFPGHGIALYYYYFWFLVCGLAAWAAGPLVGARGAVAGGTVWAGVAVIAAVALYLRDAGPAPAGARRRAIRVALALLLVSGLDVVYVVAKQLRALQLGNWFVLGTVEWWNEQVTAWTNSVLWVPHHTSALVAGLAALLLVREAAGRERRAERWALAGAAAVALASVLGLSVWVVVSLAGSWGAWILVAWWRGWRAEARLAFGGGVAGGVLALPYVADLVRANLAPGKLPVAPTIRRFYPLEVWLDARGVSTPVRALARLATLPINYFAEFGFFAVAAGVYWWWRRRSPEPLGRDEVALATVAGASVFVSTFFKAALRNNDLAARGMLMAQFVALLWAATAWVMVIRPRRAGAAPALPRWARLAFGGTLAVGAATVAYDTVMLRTYALLHVAGVGRWPDVPAGTRPDGERLLAYRRAYDAAARALPPAAVLQSNPATPAEPLHLFGVDTFTGLYARRQVAVAEREYGTLYGVADELYARARGPIDTAFGNPRQIPGPPGSPPRRVYPAPASWPAVAATCRRFGITAWVVTADDPVWRQADSWVWQRPPVVANPLVRVIAC